MPVYIPSSTQRLSIRTRGGWDHLQIRRAVRRTRACLEGRHAVPQVLRQITQDRCAPERPRGTKRKEKPASVSTPSACAQLSPQRCYHPVSYDMSLKLPLTNRHQCSGKIIYLPSSKKTSDPRSAQLQSFHPESSSGSEMGPGSGRKSPAMP